MEEVARIRGYEYIPSVLPASSGALTPEPAWVEVERRIRGALSGAGLDEVVNYSFVDPAVLPWVSCGPSRSWERRWGRSRSRTRSRRAVGDADDAARRACSRTSRATCATRRSGAALRDRPAPTSAIRKAGRTRRPVAEERAPRVRRALGAPGPPGWTAKDARDRLLRRQGRGGGDALGACRRRARPVGRPGSRRSIRAPPPQVRAGWRGAGRWASCTRGRRRRLELPAGVFVFELDLEALEKAAQLVAAVPAAPALPGGAPRPGGGGAGASCATPRSARVILEVGGPLVEDARMFDVYTGKPIPEGKKNLAYAIRYRSARADAHRRGGRRGAPAHRGRGEPRAWAAQLRGAEILSEVRRLTAF